jgi:2,4-dienoyl-CoA reductase-like NADH-dependent reductase (Old Yellow Enzyme family)
LLRLDVTALFEPLTLRDVTTRNRIWLSPMCQYSSVDGLPNNWHLVHLGAHAAGGYGLVMAEASAVVPDGRISPQDAGIWSDEHVDAWRPIAEFVRSQGSVPGIQLAHAGRKASTWSPLLDGHGSVPESEGGWPTVSSTDRPFTGYAVPRTLSTDEVAALPARFAEAAVRAEAAGFDVVEIHAAHGYLLHQFLSPLINDRTDRYGGSYDNRVRLTVEVVDAVRDAWPDDKPLFVRFSATDWAPDEGPVGWDVAQTAELAALLAGHGVDLVDVSSGGAIAEQEIAVGPGFQVPFAREIRLKSDLPTAAVGLITDPQQAEDVVAGGDADAVMLARVGLREPGWPLRAAHELGVPREQAPYPPQYVRGAWR